MLSSWDHGIAKLPTACNALLVQSVTQMYGFHAAQHDTCDVFVGSSPPPVA